jgi:hypothetical protein
VWPNGGRLIAILQEPGCHASGILTLHLGPWLQAVQVGGGALRVSSRLKDRPLIIDEGRRVGSRFRCRATVAKLGAPRVLDAA